MYIQIPRQPILSHVTNDSSPLQPLKYGPWRKVEEMGTARGDEKPGREDAKPSLITHFYTRIKTYSWPYCGY